MRIKQKYQPGAPIEAPFFPPKWGINGKVAALLSRTQACSAPDLVRYQRQAARTSFHEPVPGGDAITTSMLGLIGEVGEVVSELKKHAREGPAYSAFRSRLAEELGDLLWYAADLAERRGIQLADVNEAGMPVSSPSGRDGGWVRTALSLSEQAGRMSRSYDALLAGRTPQLAFDRQLAGALAALMHDLARLATIHQLSLVDVAAANLKKVDHRWTHRKDLSASRALSWPEAEELPACFDAWLLDQGGRVTVAFAIGDERIDVTPDPLTDNAYDPDGYRFHDIFHLAYAAVLDWSPVTRSLMQRKRKSDPRVDEVEDGGRAVAIEEGISAMVFAYASQHRMFEGVRTVDYSVLRTIRDMTAHLEVCSRTAAEWEDAIIQGFDAWRGLRDSGGGRVHVDRPARRIRLLNGDTQPEVKTHRWLA